MARPRHMRAKLTKSQKNSQKSLESAMDKKMHKAHHVVIYVYKSGERKIGVFNSSDYLLSMVTPSYWGVKIRPRMLPTTYVELDK